MWGECRIRSLRLAEFGEKVNAKKIDLLMGDPDILSSPHAEFFRHLFKTGQRLFDGFHVNSIGNPEKTGFAKTPSRHGQDFFCLKLFHESDIVLNQSFRKEIEGALGFYDLVTIRG